VLLQPFFLVSFISAETASPFYSGDSAPFWGSRAIDLFFLGFQAADDADGIAAATSVWVHGSQYFIVALSLAWTDLNIEF
jgi:hypothetical protein